MPVEKFWGAGGDNSNDGLSPDQAYETFAFAKANTVDNDTITSLTGIQNLASGQYVIDTERVWSGQPDSILTITDDAQTAVMTTSSLLNDNDSPVDIGNFDIDAGWDGASASTASALTIVEQNTGDEITYNIHDAEYTSGDFYALFIDERAGIQNITNITVSGNVSTAGALLQSTASLSAKGNQVINITGLILNPNTIAGTAKVLISLTKSTSSVNTLALNLSDITGTINTAAGSNNNLIILTNEDTVVFEDSDLAFIGEATAVIQGIIVRGVDAANPLASASIRNIDVDFFADSGFGLQYGLSTTDSHITNGDVTNVRYTGRHSQTTTAHNVVFGQGTTGVLDGGWSRDCYVNYLWSIIDGGSAANNPVSYNSNGVSFYFKGCQGGNIQGLIAAVDAATCILQGSHSDKIGVVSYASQGSFDNTGLTTGGEAYVSDALAVHALGWIEDINQSFTSGGWTWYISDSIPVDALLFSNHQTAATAPNQTFAQWNANPEIAGADTLVRLPQAELDQRIANIDPSSGPTLSISYSNQEFALNGVVNLNVAGNWLNVDPNSFGAIDLPIGLSISSVGQITGNMRMGGIIDCNITVVGLNGQKLSAGFIWYQRL